jgi:hypothetical protein
VLASGLAEVQISSSTGTAGESTCHLVRSELQHKENISVIHVQRKGTRVIEQSKPKNATMKKEQIPRLNSAGYIFVWSYTSTIQAFTFSPIIQQSEALIWQTVLMLSPFMTGQNSKSYTSQAMSFII